MLLLYRKQCINKEEDMRKVFRKIVIIAGSVLGIFLILYGTWLWYSRKAHPKTGGTIKVEGLTAAVEIYRDKEGIPHIYAGTEEDLFFAQGFVHAQDRFWQMEFWRRIGSGRLAELFGENVLGTDIYLRTVGFERIAAREYEMLDRDSRRILDAYAEGVNAYIQGRKPSKLGLEFSILKLNGVEFEIEPWTPVNTLTWAKVMSQDLDSNMGEELENVEMIRAVGPVMAGDFEAPYRDDEMPYIISDEELAVAGLIREGPVSYSLTEDLVSNLFQIDTHLAGDLDLNKGLVFGSFRSVGSNNWVISGKLTSTGMPLLANDPHLGITMPSIWYEIGLHCAGEEDKAGGNRDCGIDVRGFSFPGSPGVIIGHNSSIAWGLTALGPDVQDLYIERINPENPNQYEVNGRWLDMDLIPEEIKIHDEDEPYRFLVRKTRHGPIVTDHGFMLDYSDFGITPQKAFPENLVFTAMSLRWTALEPTTLFKAVIMLNRARNFEEFRMALSYWDTPSHNVIYADIDGNIGYQMPGLIPIRSKGDGNSPVPGWTDDYEWIGYIPFDELPYVYNPPKGYIVTANNPVVSDKYPHLIAKEFSQGYRARRITDLIKADVDGISIEDIKRMQADSLNLSAIEVLPYLENISFEDEGIEAARDFLLEWDFRMDKDSPRAALYAYFWQKLIEKTFRDQLIEKLWPPGGSRLMTMFYQILREPRNRWWDDVTTPELIETRDEILTSAFERAYELCVEDLGGKPEEWKWGDVHLAAFRNETLGESGIGPIEAIFNRGPVGVDGGVGQVNPNNWRYDEPFEVKHIASMRMIVDLGDFSNSQMMHTTGQSGHPGHRHYDDFIERWQNIRYHPALWDRSEVEKSSKKRLVLKPKN